MASILGNKYRVWIESAEGQVVELDALTVAYSMDMMSWDGQVHSRLEMEVLGTPLWTTTHDLRARINHRINQKEWQCEYCGRPNSWERQTCLGCSAVRSFIYG